VLEPAKQFLAGFFIFLRAARPSRLYSRTILVRKLPGQDGPAMQFFSQRRQLVFSQLAKFIKSHPSSLGSALIYDSTEAKSGREPGSISRVAWPST
jgi:hypothetical protein